MRHVAYLDGWLAEDRPGEQRTRVRRLRLKTGDEVPAAEPPVVIHDISAHGLLIESTQPLVVGDRLDVLLPGLGARRSMVIWNSGRFFGCDFAEPVAPEALDSALEAANGSTGPYAADEITHAAAQLEELSMAVLRIGKVVDRAIDQLLREKRRP